MKHWEHELWNLSRQGKPFRKHSHWTIINFIASDGHIKCPSDGSSGLGTIQCGFQIQETNGKPPYWSCSEFAQVVSTFSSLLFDGRGKEVNG